MRRVETNESFVREIPIQYFQGNLFKKQEYLAKAKNLIWKGLKNLKVSQSELIKICTGYILSEARKTLKEKGFKVETTKIRGETQTLAENEFLKSLAKISIGEKKTVASMRCYNSFLRWVLDDLDGREKYVKTGWSSWNRIKKENSFDSKKAN